MKLAIVGTRTFDDWAMFKRIMNTLTAKFDDILVVSGGAKGADKMAKNWAWENGYSCRIHHADWDKHGKAAGPIRNTELANDLEPGDRAIAWWDGRSPGTRHAIEKIRKRPGVKLKIIYYLKEKDEEL